MAHGSTKPDVDVTSVIPGTGATELGKAEDAGHTSGDVGIMLLAVRQDAVATLAGTDLDYAPIQVDDDGHLRITTGSQQVLVSGPRAHDATNLGNPVKIAAVATDFDPDSEGEQEQTAVAEGDIVELAADLNGLLPERVLGKYDTLAGINLVYDDAPTTATSSAVDTSRYRKGLFQFDIAVTVAPTRIRFTILVSSDGTNYATLTNGPLAALVYDDQAADGISEAIEFDVCWQSMKVKVTCTGTDSTDKFTVSNAALYLRN